MLHDLTHNHKLAGLKYRELTDLLGQPNFNDSNTVGYTVEVRYGSDIDPVYTKNLNFQLTKDSVVSSFKIEEWKK